MKLIAIIPAYNPGEEIREVIRETLNHVDFAVVVDDGCDEKNQNLINEWAEDARVILVRHKENLGKGHAIFSGFKKALDLESDFLVTLDSDGQHRPEEIKKFKSYLEREEADLLIGERETKAMPLKSRAGNVFTEKIFNFFFDSGVRDTQSGFRAFSKKFVASIMESESPGRYETEMNILIRAIKEGRKIGRVSIETIYKDNNRGSKFRPIKDSWRVIRQFAKFAVFAFSAFLLDYGIYAALNFFGGVYFVKANVISKTIAVVYYFFANKYLVFHSEGDTAREAERYILIVAINILITSSFLYLLVVGTGLSKYIAKPTADAIMFLLNFILMKRFVYDK